MKIKHQPALLNSPEVCGIMLHFLDHFTDVRQVRQDGPVHFKITSPVTLTRWYVCIVEILEAAQCRAEAASVPLIHMH
jgi:hypothetical protein